MLWKGLNAAVLQQTKRQITSKNIQEGNTYLNVGPLMQLEKAKSRDFYQI